MSRFTSKQAKANKRGRLPNRSPEKVEDAQLKVDWALQQARGSASDEVLRVVDEALALTKDDNAWPDDPRSGSVRKEIKGVLEEFIAGRGKERG